MNNKRKGFTIVELLVVVALLGLILTLAVPNAVKILLSNKQKLYEQNLELAFSSAKEYATNNLNTCKRIVSEDEAKCVSGETNKVSIQYLINNKYIIIEKNDDGSYNKMINPVNNSDMGSINYCLFYLVKEGTNGLGNVNKVIVVKE